MAGIATFDPDKMSKDRRDWLEVFGNLWGEKHPGKEPLTAEEKQALSDALNPFSK